MLGLMLSLGIIAPQPAQSVPCPCTCDCPSAEFGPQPRDHADVPFPLPETVEGLIYLTTSGEGSINFQTPLSLDAVLHFYREALAAQGLTERSLTTVITPDVLSLVFEGWPGGKTLVLQSVNLGGRSNVNLRFEAL